MAELCNGRGTCFSHTRPARVRDADNKGREINRLGKHGIKQLDIIDHCTINTCDGHGSERYCTPIHERIIKQNEKLKIRYAKCTAKDCQRVVALKPLHAKCGGMSQTHDEQTTRIKTLPMYNQQQTARKAKLMLT